MSRRCAVYACLVLAACSSRQPPVSGVCVDAPRPQASAGLVDGGTDVSVEGGADAATDGRDNDCTALDCRRLIDDRPFSQRAEEDYGLKLTDEEKIIVDTCPPRRWSKNVPDRDCTKDNECGDGFCDRGHCRAIKTCAQQYGCPCKDSRLCSGVCFEGRCRSCVSDKECQQKREGIDPEWARTHKASCVPNGVGDNIPMMCW